MTFFLSWLSVQSCLLFRFLSNNHTYILAGSRWRLLCEFEKVGGEEGEIVSSWFNSNKPSHSLSLSN